MYREKANDYNRDICESNLLSVDLVEGMFPLGFAGGEVEVVELSAHRVDTVVKKEEDIK